MAWFIFLVKVEMDGKGIRETGGKEMKVRVKKVM
jgi:hypothetical protein